MAYPSVKDGVEGYHTHNSAASKCAPLDCRQKERPNSEYINSSNNTTISSSETEW